MRYRLGSISWDTTDLIWLLQVNQSNAAIAVLRDITRGKRPLDNGVANNVANDVADGELPVPKRRNLTHTVLGRALSYWRSGSR